MKKVNFYIMLMAIILMPKSVFALDEQFIEVAKEEKYYKTITYELDVVRSSEIPSTLTIEITKDEYESFDPTITPQVSAGTVTTYKKLTTYILTNGNNFRYKATLEWKNIPKVRSYDTIGIGHYGSVIINGTPSFSQTYCLVDGDCRTINSYYENITDFGSAATFKIPSGDLESLNQTFYFDVKKRDSSTTVITQNASGDYSHAIRTVTATQAQNFTISNSGIHYNNSVIDYFDEIQYARAVWTGSW